MKPLAVLTFVWLAAFAVVAAVVYLEIVRPVLSAA